MRPDGLAASGVQLRDKCPQQVYSVAYVARFEV